jgi:2-polyprenyl-3-methyl-5-hydroxy-6-metoxy-1,4-benzoquinol methylase
MTPIEPDRMDRARQLSAEFVANGDPTGWFERLYEEGQAGEAVVPWIQGVPNEILVEWAREQQPGTGRTALVVGCGTGEDAEYLASRGFAVTAFDIAPTAIAAARERYPQSAVDYQVADLTALPGAWSGAFDLVVEIYTLQPLYGEIRAKALAAVHEPVAPGGTLLVISFATTEDNPARDPKMMPWPLTHAEIKAAGGPLRARSVDHFMGRNPDLPRWRAEFARD